MTASMVRILGLLGAALLLASCSGPFFSKVEVKTSPTVYAALGNAKANISDYMSVAKVKDMLKGSAGVQVYDYQDPTDTAATQKFLIKYPLTSVQLDFGQYLKDLNLEGTLGQALTPMSFPIPTVNQTQSSTASFDLNTTLRSSMNTGFGTVQAPFVETGITATPPALDAPVSVSMFSTATFSAGSLNIGLAMAPGASASLALTATVSLVNSSGTVISGPSASVNIKTGGTVSLPLTGVTLTSNFKVRFNITTSGGTALKSSPINVSPSLSSDIAISAATGVNLSTNVTVPALNVPMSAATNFVKAVVGTGSLAIDTGTLPAGWLGFTRTTTIGLTQTGGLNATPAASTSQTINVDLAGQTITTANMAVTASIKIDAVNASFSGLTNTPTSLAFSAAFSVSQFTSVVVKPGAAFTPTQTFNQPTSQQMKDWVNSIDFTKVGVEIAFTNNLPNGNDMTINATSLAFSISGVSQTLSSNTTTTVQFLNPTASVGTPFVYVPANFANIDFKVDLQPKAFNSGTGEMTLYNIVPGTTLTFSGSVKLIDVWSKANIKPPAAGYSGKFPDTGTTDLSVLADYLGPGLGLGPIDSYLYVSGLNPAGVTGLTGLVQATYTDGVTPKTFDFLAGAASAPKAINMLAAAPTLTATGDIINTALDVSATAISAKLGDFATPLNAKPKDLALTYKLNMTGMDITQADANGTGGPKTLQADLIVIIPVVLVASGGTAELKVGNALPTTDLFGRKAGGDNSNINNMLDKLVSMNMSLAIDNKIGFGGVATLTDGAAFTKTLTLAKDVSSPSLVLGSADIKLIRNTVPFVLKLKVQIPDATYSIKRGGTINANITVNAVTDIDQTFNLRGTN